MPIISLEMLHEITTDQARAIAALRHRFPGAVVRSHQRPWGVIVEARRGHRVLDIIALDGAGAVEHARPVFSLAA